PDSLLVHVRVAGIAVEHVREFDPVFALANGPLTRVDDVVGTEALVGGFVWLFHRANADPDKILTRLRVFVSQAYITREELFHRTHDGVVSFRIVLLEPLPEILVAMVTQAVDHARPIEPRALVVALLRIRKVEFRLDRTVGNPGFGRIG